MNNVEIKLILEENGVSAAENIIAFKFVNALYVPYTKLTATFYVNGKLKAGKVRRIELYIDGKLKHNGLPDYTKTQEYDDKTKVIIISSGYSILLCQSEPFPQINSNVNLGDLIENNVNSPHVSFETGTSDEDYIYVKEKSTVWDAVIAYSLKNTGNYPYIRDVNKVMVSFLDSVEINYTDVHKMDEATVLNTSSMVSQAFMSDLDGEYTYSSVSTQAEKYGVARRKYYPLDYQWLYSPQIGLDAKLNYFIRDGLETSVRYCGYLGEQIMDKATYFGDVSGKRINYICILGNKKGIFTTVKFYDDAYGQR